MPTPTFQLAITALFSLVATGNVLAQSTTERVFHFAHTPIEQGTREIATAIRVIAGAQDVSADFSAGTLSVHGTVMTIRKFAADPYTVKDLINFGTFTLDLAVVMEACVRGKLNVLVQMAFDRLAELPQVPSALDLVSDPDSKRVLELILIRQEMGRPIAAPPGVPAERVAALRQAFDATMKDPDFLAEAQRFRMELDPLASDRIGRILTTAYGASREIVQRAAALVQPSTRKPE